MPTLLTALALILVGWVLLAYLVVCEARRRQVEERRAVYRARHAEAMAHVERTVLEARREEEVARLAAERKAAEQEAAGPTTPPIAPDEKSELLDEVEEFAEASPEKVSDVVRLMMVDLTPPASESPATP